MKSKITGGPATLLFNAKILNKYDVDFFRCDETGFIQTEEPYWLDEAYSSAITKLDLGLVSRNIQLAEKTEKIIQEHFDPKTRFLDYAGGYGMFTRIMRDKGFDYYHMDPYCENLFAEYFSLNDTGDDTRFELTTSFEVAEHLANPREEFKQMIGRSDSLLFTTELVPDTLIDSVSDWWYFIPETGQHVSFYTREALQHLADLYGFQFYTDNYGLHLFTRKAIADPFKTKKEPLLIRKARRMIARFDRKKQCQNGSLLQQDLQMVRNKISG
ncbi:MAG: class I SAM-dependent methyltransferase [Mucilaginibacter polytrichastri]|nr:class I SAM-dependent methyltransferase [Mucilaginibacter polytrichastri]